MHSVAVRNVVIGSFRTVVMGIVNVTPDSFSDGGSFLHVSGVLASVESWISAGCELVDIGGESTRPGAAAVSAAEEIERVVPAIRALRAVHRALVISVDTVKSEVAARALEAGADMINDVSGGLIDPELFSVASHFDAPVVLGHMRGTPATMMQNIHFDDVVEEVATELFDRASAAKRAGISADKIVVDPGIGFGKELPHNIALLTASRKISHAAGAPILVGPSRKAFLGTLTGISQAHLRDMPTAAAVTAAILGGAHAVRVHAVSEMVSVAKVADALRAGFGQSQC